MNPTIASLLSNAAQRYGLDPAMLSRLAMTESGGNPSARSPAGAVGVMQLMPGTAHELGVDPSDPAQNVDGGARYLKQQLDRFGSPELALAAYNAGPGRVAKAGGVPNIPETQAYVGKVMGKGADIFGGSGSTAMAGGSGADIFGMGEPQATHSGSGADIFGDAPAPAQAPKMDMGAPFPSAASVRALGKPNVITDVAKSGVAGLNQGVTSMVGQFGDMANLGGRVGEMIARLGGRAAGVPESRLAPSGMNWAHAGGIPTSQDLNAVRQNVAGQDYQPQTTAGEYARTAGQFAPAMGAGSGGLIRRLVQAATPAVVSETAGQFTKGTKLEPAARIVGGIVGGAMAPGAAATVEALPGAPARAAARAIVDPTPVQILKNAGVKLTPGQQMGGLAKNVEDLGIRAPILGSAISGARQRGNVSLNRAVANDALGEIGETVPAHVPTGHDSVGYVATRLGQEYDRAADLVPAVAPDDAFRASMAELDKRIGELPTDVGAQYQNILKNRLYSRLGGGAAEDANGAAPVAGAQPITGRQLRNIQSEIGSIAAERSASADGAQQELGHMLEDVSSNLKGLLGRASPEAGAIISKTNAGWSKYVRLRSAAAKNPSGIFTPGQLSTAVRTSDKSVGKGNVAKGQAVMQDLSKAASTIMPDQFGNPGTANALGLGGMLVGMGTAPVQTAGAAGALSAAAIPYAMMGRGLAKAAPKAAPTPQQMQEALRVIEAHRQQQIAARAMPLIPSTVLGGVLAH